MSEISPDCGLSENSGNPAFPPAWVAFNLIFELFVYLGLTDISDQDQSFYCDIMLQSLLITENSVSVLRLIIYVRSRGGNSSG